MEKQKLNVDLPKAITDFEAAAKEFELKEKLWRIIFRGKGLEFDKYRDYAPDEDASDIDWKASLKANKLIAKQYIEERDLKIMFIIDVSEDMLLGSFEKLKCEYATEIVGALAHMILRGGDLVGYALYADKIKYFAPPRGGDDQFFHIMDILADPSTYGGGSRFDIALKFVLDYLDQSIDAVIYVSDFINVREHATEDLFLSAHKYECMGIMIRDRLDKTFPNIDREIVLEDPETGEQILVNPKKIRALYEHQASIFEQTVKNIFKKGDIDLLEVTTDESFAFPLAAFLGERVEAGKSVG